MFSEFISFPHLRLTRLILDYCGEPILKHGFGLGFIQIAGQGDFQRTLTGVAQTRTCPQIHRPDGRPLFTGGQSRFVRTMPPPGGNLDGNKPRGDGDGSERLQGRRTKGGANRQLN